MVALLVYILCLVYVYDRADKHARLPGIIAIWQGALDAVTVDIGHNSTMFAYLSDNT